MRSSESSAILRGVPLGMLMGTVTGAATASDAGTESLTGFSGGRVFSVCPKQQAIVAERTIPTRLCLEKLLLIICSSLMDGSKSQAARTKKRRTDPARLCGKAKWDPSKPKMKH